MKVLHIASGDLWAGAEKALYTLVLALQQSSQVGVSAVILNPGALAEKPRDAGVELLVLDESCQNTKQLIVSVSQWVARTQPDIIHTHRTKENIIGSLVGARHRIPSVRTQHGASGVRLAPSTCQKGSFTTSTIYRAESSKAGLSRCPARWQRVCERASARKRFASLPMASIQMASHAIKRKNFCLLSQLESWVDWRR